MEPIVYFYIICVVLVILIGAFLTFLFIWNVKPVIAVSEFTRRR